MPDKQRFHFLDVFQESPEGTLTPKFRDLSMERKEDGAFKILGFFK